MQTCSKLNDLLATKVAMVLLLSATVAVVLLLSATVAVVLLLSITVAVVLLRSITVAVVLLRSTTVAVVLLLACSTISKPIISGYTTLQFPHSRPAIDQPCFSRFTDGLLRFTGLFY